MYIIKFVKNKAKEKLYISTFVSLVFKGIAAVATFFLSVFVARYLGPHQSGVFLLSINFITFISSFCRIGLDETIVRHIAAVKPVEDYRYSLLVKSLLLTSIISLFAALIIYFYSDYLSDLFFNSRQYSSTMSAIAPSIIGLSILNICAKYLQGLSKFKSSIFAMNIFVNGLLIFYIVTLAPNQATSTAYAYSLFSIISALVILCYCFILSDKKSLAVFNWRRIFQSCFPLWIVLVMGQVILWISQFIAANYVPPDKLALLAVSQRASMLTSLVLMAINLVVAPKFSALHNSDQHEKLEKVAKWSIKLTLVVAAPLLIVLLIFPTYILSLFGSEFVHAADLLRILTIGQFVNVLSGSVGMLLMMCGYERDMRNIVIVSGIISVVLASSLIPHWGILGAAISTALTVIIQNLLAVVAVRKRLGFNTLNLL